ncbi:MAG: argininosuccinate lyase, partial [Acidimicrobiales bacterium]
MTLWQGRFGGEASEELMALTESLSFDRRLAADDLAGTEAHVRGLERAGVLTAGEVAILVAALEHVGEELGQDQLLFDPGDEDIHTAI